MDRLLSDISIDDSSSRRGILLVFVAAVFTNTFLWAAYMTWIGDPAGIAWTKWASLPLVCIGLLFALRGHVWVCHVLATAALYLTLVPHVWMTGIAHVDTAWLFMVPIAGFLLGERLLGGIWLTLSALTVTVVHFFGPDQTYVFASPGLQALFAYAFLVTTAALTFMFSTTLARSLKHGRDHRAELERTNAELMRTVMERDEAVRRSHQADKLRSLGSLAGQFAHDYNNMLAVIQTELELALDEEDLDPFLFEGLELALDAARASGKLTASMLSFSGRAAQSSESVDLRALLEDSGNLAAAATSRVVPVEFDDTEQLIASGDRDQLEQVFLHLIVNAIEATAETGRNAPVEVALNPIEDGSTVELGEHSVGELAAGPHVEVVIQDSGSGMTDETMSQMFEPFFTRREQGRGMGLSMVIGTVDAHGGAVDVASVPGEGTRISVLLPVEPSLANELHTKDRAFVAEIEGRIAVVDDNDRVRASTARLLESFGYEVERFADGVSALDAISQSPEDFAIAFIDYMMLPMKGDEVIVELASVAPTVRTVLMSGHVGETVEAVTLRNEANYIGFLAKPFSADELAELLNLGKSTSPRMMTM